MYDTILRLVQVWYDPISRSMYDINLGATTTMILSTWGAKIPIDLVSSATNSIRQCIVLFKLYCYWPQTLSLSSCVNQVLVAQNLQTSPWTPRTLGISPTPLSPRITLIATIPVLSPSTWNRNSITREPNILVTAHLLKSSSMFHSNITSSCMSGSEMCIVQEREQDRITTPDRYRTGGEATRWDHISKIKS